MNKNEVNQPKMTMYFDLSNPYQRECHDLLLKVQKKKTLFVSLLVHDFMEQFNSELSADDLSNYIKSYELIRKMKTSGQPSVPLAETASAPPNPPIASNSVAEEDVRENPAKDVSNIMAAMSAFSTQ